MTGLIPAMPPVRVVRARFPEINEREVGVMDAVAPQVRQRPTAQATFKKVARTPGFWGPLGFLLLVGAVLTGMSHWAARTIIMYWIVLPAVAGFGIVWVGSTLLLIVDLYHEPSWRTLFKVRWTYVTSALILGFFAG